MSSRFGNVCHQTAKSWSAVFRPRSGRLNTPCITLSNAVRPLTCNEFRGAKTKTTTRLRDLPQGGLPAPSDQEKEDDPVPSYPPVIQQHLNHVKQFGDCVILTRVGNFYELYAEQAEHYGPLLNLKVAKRRTALGPVAMSGFQVFQLDRYLKLLVQDLNKQVAISDEIRHSAADQVRSGGLMYDRKVTRVITAGTLIDENFMDPYENNFLVAIHTGTVIDDNGSTRRQDKACVGLSWVDLSSGDFFLQQAEFASLGTILARIAPREIVLDTTLENVDQHGLKDVLDIGSHMLTYHGLPSTADWSRKWNELLDRPMSEAEMQISNLEIMSGSLLLDYVRSKVHSLRVTLRPPVRRSEDEYLRIDRQSLRGLEIKETLREGNYAGSLLHAIRRTVTKGGARLLARRLVSPFMSLKAINDRLSLVSEMLHQESLRENTNSILRRSSDTLRLLQKFSIGRGEADDLLSLAKTIEVMQHLSSTLDSHINERKLQNKSPLQDLFYLEDLLQTLDLKGPNKLRRRIRDSIDEEGLSRQTLAEQAEAAAVAGFVEQVEDAIDTAIPVKRPRKKDSAQEIDMNDGEIWIMRKCASTVLRQAHAELESLLTERAELVDILRTRLGCNSLTFKWSPQNGHHCHVRGKDCKATIPSARNISSTKTTRTFHLPDSTTLGLHIDQAKTRIRAEEQRVFVSLRDEVIQNLVKMRRNAVVLDELDIACSFAEVAQERNWVRPILHEGNSHNIVAGRHPTVDLGLQESGRQFVSNDCSLHERQQILLITGPNMAGKSTYLRQNALISILAQTGSFVPAQYAEIGLVDKIFSRIGSADNLSRHQSTFMVEMVEVAEILNQATSRSFVIMDEVGRGTTPEDGIAVGYACLHHLHEKIKCRSLFATHFHTLADMTEGFNRLSCYCTDVAEEEDGSWIYVHKLRMGVNRDSHALKVARLAGVPEEAISVAVDVLSRLRSGDGDSLASAQAAQAVEQLRIQASG